MQKKILVIEDEKQLLKNISTLLKAEEYDVIISTNGYDGIRLAKESKPDLIICDIMMPGIDGYDVIKTLNRDMITSTIPFIFLTAKVEKHELRKGMELGADDYIFKPFESEQLLRAIQTRLNKFEVIKAKILEDADRKKGLSEVDKKYQPGENILFQLHSSSILVTIDKIKYITANNQYTYLVLCENKHVLIRRSVSKWEKMLPEDNFIRIHRSTIINTSYISQIEKVAGNGHKLSLKDTPGSFTISRRFYRKLKDRN